MINWRRSFISWASGSALIFAIDRPICIEVCAGAALAAAVFLALGYLRERR